MTVDAALQKMCKCLQPWTSEAKALLGATKEATQMSCLMPSHVNCHDVEVVIGIFDPLAAELPGSTLFVSLYFMKKYLLFSLPLAAPLRRLRRRWSFDPLAAASGGVDPLIL